MVDPRSNSYIEKDKKQTKVKESNKETEPERQKMKQDRIKY